MSSLAEEIGSSAIGFFSGITSSVGIIAIIVFVIAITIVGLIAMILLKRRFDFEGSGEQLGHMDIHIMGKYSLVGNVAEWEMIDPEQLDLLKHADEKLRIVPDVIRQMQNEKSLFIYTIKTTDDSDILDKFGNRIFIISSGNLKSDIYSYTSQKGKFTLRSILSKEKTRHVVAYSSAKKIQVLNEDKNIDDWWIIAPLPMVANKDMIGFDSKAIHGMTHYIEIKEITNAKALAHSLDFVPFVTNALLKNETIKKELEETNKQLELLHKENSSVNQKLQKKKMQLGQKPYVINGKLDEKKHESMNIIMMIVAVVMGAMSAMYMPQFFPNMTEQSAQFIGMVIAIVIIGVIGYYMNNKKPEPVEDNVRND